MSDKKKRWKSIASRNLKEGYMETPREAIICNDGVITVNEWVNGSGEVDFFLGQELEQKIRSDISKLEATLASKIEEITGEPVSDELKEQLKLAVSNTFESVSGFMLTGKV